MTTVIVRRVASTPLRTASETWEKIMSLLTPEPTSVAHKELAKATGVACASISSEAPMDAPIVVWGGGPRVRIYCAFGDDALAGSDVNEDAVSRSPTEGDWNMSIPCMPEDVKWSNAKLASVSPRIAARSLEEDVEDRQDASAQASRSLPIDLDEFLKP